VVLGLVARRAVDPHVAAAVEITDEDLLMERVGSGLG